MAANPPVTPPVTNPGIGIQESASAFGGSGNDMLDNSGNDMLQDPVKAQELPIKSGVSAMDMAETMFGDGVKIVSATYKGDAQSAGVYYEGEITSAGVVPSNSGVILSTGNVTDFTNSSGMANQSGSMSTDTSGMNNMAEMNKIAGVATYDAAQFQAEFVPEGDTITMRLVFSSEEYPEWVDSGYNDAVGIWVNGVKVQLTVGDGNISIDNINADTNENLYNDNTGGTYNTEMDGATGVLTLKAPVIPGQVNSIVICIADAGDSIYDSNLMIVADSVQTALIANDDTLVVKDGSVDLDLMVNDMTKGREGVHISQINDQDIKIGESIKLNTGETVTLNKDGTVTLKTTGHSDQVTFSYTITDAKGTADTAFVTIDAEHEKPATVDAVDDTAIVTRKGEITFDVLTNDEISDKSTLVITEINGQSVNAGEKVQLGSGEVIVLNQNGTITFYATSKTDKLSFDYTVSSAGGVTDTAKVDIIGNPVDGTQKDDQMAVNYIDADGQMIDGRDGNAEVIMGYGGNDKITAGLGDDDIYGGTGNDFVRAGDGADIIIGGDGDDVLDGQFGNDSINGGLGNDVFWIYDQADIVTEGSNGGYDKVLTNFSHTLSANFEELWLNEGSAATNGTGNASANKIVGNANANNIQGLGGNDSLFGNAGHDKLDGAAGNDNIWGGAGNDSISGGDGIDKIYGEAGDDLIYGGAGNDNLSGGDGADMFWSGTGKDILGGGKGADVFVFMKGNQADTITDFENDVDHIQLSGTSFDKLGIRQSGANVVVTYDTGDTVTIKNLTVSQLDAHDFLFV